MQNLLQYNTILIKVTVKPDSVCPSQNLTCKADTVVGMEWRGDLFDEAIYYTLLCSSQDVH